MKKWKMKKNFYLFFSDDDLKYVRNVWINSRSI
jgi:hypothetical protein